MADHQQYKAERWTCSGAEELPSHPGIDSARCFVQLGTMLSTIARTLLVPALLICIAFTAGAQPNVDSILHVLESAPPDSNRLRTLSRAGTIFMERGDLDRAIGLYTEFTELARTPVQKASALRSWARRTTTWAKGLRP